MFCSRCGSQVGPEARFCSDCGAPVAAGAKPTSSPSSGTSGGTASGRGWLWGLIPTALLVGIVGGFFIGYLLAREPGEGTQSAEASGSTTGTMLSTTETMSIQTTTSTIPSTSLSQTSVSWAASTSTSRVTTTSRAPTTTRSSPTTTEPRPMEGWPDREGWTALVWVALTRSDARVGADVLLQAGLPAGIVYAGDVHITSASGQALGSPPDHWVVFSGVFDREIDAQKQCDVIAGVLQQVDEELCMLLRVVRVMPSR